MTRSYRAPPAGPQTRSASRTVARLARQKAADVAAQVESGIVIGCDTVAECMGQVLGKPVEYVDQRIAEGKNASDEITDDIPVYVSYFTAWPDPVTGVVGYHADMYERDVYLSRAIDNTSSVRHAES